jgi:hypothetical protein
VKSIAVVVLCSLSTAVTALAGAALVAACSDSSSSSTTTDGDGGSSEASLDGGGPAANGATCELTRSYSIGCNAGKDGGDPLTCGPDQFDAWCALNDTAINSESYRRAEAMCLTQDNCDGLARRACEYASYATATPTEAQKQVVAAYCQTCEPADTAGCAARKTAYDTTLGPKSTDDVFTAAWELSDALDDAIRTQCTGATLDAGASAADCLNAFGNCAGGVYVDALPACPK